MPERVLKIRGMDPLLFRDGRPFTNEPGAQAARTLKIPMPGTIAGFLRTRVGEELGWDWANGGAEAAKNVQVYAPIAMRNKEAVFAAPADYIVVKDEKGHLAQAQVSALSLRPIPVMNGGGCNLPNGLLPVGAVQPDADNVLSKPQGGYEFWLWSELQKWLLDATGDQTGVPKKIEGPPMEERVHVGIDKDKGASEEGMLFTVQFRSFEYYRWPHVKAEAGQDGQTAVAEEWHLLARVAMPQDCNLVGPGLLGGERRLAVVAQADASDWPSCTAELAHALSSAQRVRMILATPAVFDGGWKPGWLDDNLCGSPPGSDVRLRLVSAVVPRHQAVSGWDYARKEPKPVRWLVPAGSVFFFEVLDGKPAQLADQLWLAPVSDGEQDRRDGYGLALWGLWESKGG